MKSSSPNWSGKSADCIASRDDTLPPIPGSRDSVEAAARVRREIRDACRRLAQHPHSGHQRSDLTTRQDVLFWPVYSYLIIYRPDKKPLEVLRVLHGNRDLTRILG